MEDRVDVRGEVVNVREVLWMWDGAAMAGA